MKVRHFALLIVTLLVVVFMQPIVLLVGGIALIGGVLALIFADLPHDQQDAWETTATHLVQRATAGLKTLSRREPILPVVNATEIKNRRAGNRGRPRQA